MVVKKCVIIPTLNEEGGIGKVIRSIPKGYDVYVIDGGSKDKTVAIAKIFGANIIRCSKKGKGHAIKKSLKELNYDVYVLIDGDGTYNGKDIPKLVRPILDKKAEVVLGSRFLGKKPKMNFSRFVGNKIFNQIFNILNKSHYSDVVTGLRALSSKFVRNINLSSEDFKIETEITMLANNNGYRVVEIPIEYHQRFGQSKLRINDMVKIFFYMIYASFFKPD